MCANHTPQSSIDTSPSPRGDRASIRPDTRGCHPIPGSQRGATASAAAVPDRKAPTISPPRWREQVTGFELKGVHVGTTARRFGFGRALRPACAKVCRVIPHRATRHPGQPSPCDRCGQLSLGTQARDRPPTVPRRSGGPIQIADGVPLSVTARRCGFLPHRPLPCADRHGLSRPSPFGLDRRHTVAPRAQEFQRPEPVSR